VQKILYFYKHYQVFAIILSLFFALVLLKILEVFLKTIFKHSSKFKHASHIENFLKILKICKKPLYVTLLIVIIWYVLSLSLTKHPFWQTITKIVKSIILIIWDITGLKVIKSFSEKVLKRWTASGHLGTDVAFLIKNLGYALVVIVGIFVLMSIWNLNLSPFLASAGIAGIALALAAKETLSNFFGGISIFLDKSYKVGDYIILDSGERGEVVDIGIRSTCIRTRDDVMITIPNSIMANSKIINESSPEPRFRLRIPIGVSYDSDLEKVEKVLLELVKSVENVVKDPEPRVRYREFGDSSINLELLCWVDDPRNRGPVTHRLIKLIHKRFKEEGIIIPFPQRDVHIYEQKF